MFCTSRERETCDVEKMTCEGCFYENETPEKKIERLEIVKDMLDGEVKLLRDELNQEKEKNKKLEEENKYLEDYIDGMEGGLKEQIKEQSRAIAELEEQLQEK